MNRFLIERPGFGLDNLKSEKGEKMNRRKAVKRGKRLAQKKRRTQQKNRKRIRQTQYIKAILLLLFFVSFFILYQQVDEGLIDYDELRYMYVNESHLFYFENYGTINKVNPYPYLASFMKENDYNLKNFDIKKVNTFVDELPWYKRKNMRNKVTTLTGFLEKVYGDVKVFPVPIDMKKQQYTYEDTYGAERTYGGKRQHLGTDIMDVRNQTGRLPILSMTDGYIRSLGWNEKGGWRIGIQSPQGTYFYYAHLESYVAGISEGDRIKAGEIIGYMGDSGYGKEGTTGQFPVHLHLGIMLDDFTEEELWINPYYVLKYIELRAKNHWVQP